MTERISQGLILLSLMLLVLAGAAPATARGLSGVAGLFSGEGGSRPAGSAL